MEKTKLKQLAKKAKVVATSFLILETLVAGTMVNIEIVKRFENYMNNSYLIEKTTDYSAYKGLVSSSHLYKVEDEKR